MHGETESNNPEDKYALAIKKDGKIVAHLPLRKNGKLAKTIFFSPRWSVPVTGKAVHLGDGDGM